MNIVFILNKYLHIEEKHFQNERNYTKTITIVPLTHLTMMFHFYIPWKCKIIRGLSFLKI